MSDETYKYSSEIAKKWFQSKKFIWENENVYNYNSCSCCDKYLLTFTVNPEFGKHHCRSCGKIICNLCSRAPEGVALKKGCLERVCKNCWPELEALLTPQIIKPLEQSIEQSSIDDCTDKSIHLQVDI